MPAGSRAPVDTLPFQPVVDQALAAFAQDFGYAEAMLLAAAAISHKREVWSHRTELREAEDLARATCASAGHACVSVSPCGFGDCAFASTVNVSVTVISTRGKDRRPAPSAYPSYDREAALTCVLARNSTTGV